MGILGVYMHFHSSTEVTCPWMSSSTQETARLWMPPPHEEEHAVHGVASHLQKQGESSGQTRTLPTSSVSFPTNPFPVPIGAIRFWEATLQRTKSQLRPEIWRVREDSMLAKVLCKPRSSTQMWEITLGEWSTRITVGSVAYSKEGCSVLLLTASV